MVDGHHSAATGYNLRYSQSGAGTWTTGSGVNSPCSITGLSGAAGADVEVQHASSIASTSSAITTGTTWGATAVPGSLTVAAAPVRGTDLAPGGGANLTATPAPTAVAGAAIAWSATPPFGLRPIWSRPAPTARPPRPMAGASISTPFTAGTYYLWMLAQNVGGAG